MQVMCVSCSNLVLPTSSMWEGRATDPGIALGLCNVADHRLGVRGADVHALTAPSLSLCPDLEHYVVKMLLMKQQANQK